MIPETTAILASDGSRRHRAEWGRGFEAPKAPKSRRRRCSNLPLLAKTNPPCSLICLR